jgi:hypothetical protein
MFMIGRKVPQRRLHLRQANLKIAVRALVPALRRIDASQDSERTACVSRFVRNVGESAVMHDAARIALGMAGNLRGCRWHRDKRARTTSDRDAH